MAYTIQTSKQNLFGVTDSFYAEAQYTITPNHKNGTFKVQITGVRGYGSVKWNFHQRITTWIASDSAGTGKVTPTNYNSDGYIKINSSGSNTYTGYMPKSGYQAVEGCEKEFTYNSDGTAPDVYIYLKCYNPAVQKLTDGSWRAVNVSTTTNVMSNVTKRDMAKPTFTATKTKIELTKVGLSTTPTGGFTFDRWEVQVCDDGDPKAKDYTYNEASISKEYTVIHPEQIVWVRGRNSYNNQWSTWQKLIYDCNKPTINDVKLVATKSNQAKLSFKSDYKVQYRITNTDNKIDSGWLGPVDAKTSPEALITIVSNKNITYNLEVRRYDNNKLYNSTTVSCNSSVPILTISNLVVSGTTVTFDVSSDTNCNEWSVSFTNNNKADNPEDIPDNEKDPNDPIKITNVNTKKIQVRVDRIAINVNYTVVVKGKSSTSGLIGSTSRSNVISLGVIQIYDKSLNDYKSASVYIYDDKLKQWLGAVPLMYIDDSSNFPEYTPDWYVVGLKQQKFNT